MLSASMNLCLYRSNLVLCNFSKYNKPVKNNQFLHLYPRCLVFVKLKVWRTHQGSAQSPRLCKSMKYMRFAGRDQYVFPFVLTMEQLLPWCCMNKLQSSSSDTVTQSHTVGYSSPSHDRPLKPFSSIV